jgi:hypothetical protein
MHCRGSKIGFLGREGGWAPERTVRKVTFDHHLEFWENCFWIRRSQELIDLVGKKADLLICQQDRGYDN